MLVLLVQMYRTIPELGDNAPTVYHLLWARYSICHSIFQQRMRTCASVLQELSTWMRRDASPLTHLFPCLHACFNLIYCCCLRSAWKRNEFCTRRTCVQVHDYKLFEE